VLVGFFLAADWALVIVINKRLLAAFHPLPFNLIARFASLFWLLALTVPLTAFGLWDLTFDLTPEAAGYIAISAVTTWLVAFNAYYYALREGKASVVAPITATDPVWAALFAPILLGTGMDPLVVAGLVISTVGVIFIARWMTDEPVELLDTTTIPVTAAPTETIGDGAGAGRTAAVSVAALSLVAAAGWGLGPVLIELAENANGGASAAMMVGSQVLGMILLGAVVLVRRSPILLRPLGPERRKLLALLLLAGLLDAVFSVLYYLIIEAIGAVLTLLITATSPVFAIIGGAILLREHVSRRMAFAAAITIVGVMVAILSRVF
jgi:drug/metabolite transporter (DMT)-like permease